MPKPSTPEISILFLNNLAGDDLWEHGHLILRGYEKHSVPLERLQYKYGSRGSYPSEGVYVTSVPYALNGYGKIQLYGFPFLAISVDPFDLDYPIPVQGLVVTEDMRMFDYFIEQDQEFLKLSDPQFSRLAWAKTRGLPTVLAVHHADDHEGDLEILSRIVGMEIDCPVLWHNGELNSEFLRRAIETVFSEIKQI